MFGPVNNKTYSALLICLLLLAAMFARNALNPQLVSAGSPTFAVQAFDADGNYLPNVVPNVTPDSSGDLFISFSKHSQFKPGLYYVRVYVVKGGIVYVSDSSFRWGVVALNFDKTVYSPTDQVNIGFGVLNDLGRTVCDADAQLSITGPGGAQAVYTTENSSIQKSAVCGPNTITNLPDYSVHFAPGTVGIYQVTVTANTGSGVRTVSDTFEVRSDAPFDVSRDAPTRMYPPVRYKVSMRVIPAQDFSGVITEPVPASFTVSQMGFGEDEVTLDAATTTTSGENAVLTWHVSLNAGVAKTLWYVFKALDVSPEFYLTGPLTFTPDDLSKPQWQETRQWQIAADACGFGAALGNGECQGAITSTASTTWTVPSDWNNASNTIEVIGGGGGGGTDGGNGLDAGGGGGGGGGAYAKVSNFSTSTGNSVQIHVGPGGAAAANGSSTWFNNLSCSAASVCGAAGSLGGNVTGGAGGTTANSTGTTKTAGGNGGDGFFFSGVGASGGGGGGAGGLHGIGAAGGFGISFSDGGGGGGGGNGGGSQGEATSSNGTNGANGGNNFSGSGRGTGGTGAGGNGTNGGGGAGGAGTAGAGGASAGGTGSQGTEWSSASPTAGSGGGGGGGGGDIRTNATGNNGGNGNNGGTYGGGGGGGGGCNDTGCAGGTGGIGAQGAIVITYNFAFTSSTESRYRWRNDDGSESGASWQVAENTAGTATSTANVYRIRFEAANSGNITSTKNFKLEYQASATSGAWTAMPSTSTLTTQLFVMTTSTQAGLTDGTSTTAQLTADATKFVAGTLEESTSSSGNITLNSTLSTTTFTEVEYVLSVTTSTTGSSDGTYYFRVTDAGTALDAYTQYAQLTLNLPKPPNRPILNIPAPGVTTTLTGIIFEQTATSNTSSSLQYKSVIYQNEACTQLVETHDQSGSQTGWTGQNASSSQEYLSGSTGIFTTTSTLTSSTTYYWGAYAKDPEGSNTFGAGGTTALSSLTWNTNPNALPSALAFHSAVVYNGYIYVTGGGSPTSTVLYAPINASGTVGTWATTTALPSAIDSHSAVAYNGYLYTTGGEDNLANATSSVFYAPINANGTVGAWTTNANHLPVSSLHHVAVAYNGYIYVTEGTVELSPGSRSFTSTVVYAPINSTGSIGAWQTTAALPSAVTNHISVAYNGYLYTIGGGTSADLVTSTIFYAPINSSGTVGAWQTNPKSLPTATSLGSGGVYNGYIYVTGGTVTGGGSTSTVIYAPINSSGTVGTWTTTSALPLADNTHSAVISNGYLYVTLGSTSSVFYAQINQQGSTDSANGWKYLNALPSALEAHSAIAYNGYLYVTGGCNASCANSTSTVLYAPINASGTVDVWQTNANALPSAIHSHSAVAYNGYLYTTGGSNGTITSTVFYAPINSNGAVGAWATNVHSLPSAIDSHSAVAYNGYIYTTGGVPTIGTTSTVFYAPINTDHTVGTWLTTTALPSPVDSHSAVAYNGYLYVTGGENVAAKTSTVFYAPINANGTVGSWVTTTKLPSALAGHSAVAYNGYLYTTGGTNGSTVTSTVFYAQILPQAIGSGTISSWLTATALPSAINFHSAVVYNGYIYNTGGSTDAGVTVTSTVQSIGLYTSCTAFTATQPANSAPVVSAVSLNHGSPITLIGNATTSFDINYTVSDVDGCTDIQDGLTTSTAFRTGVAGTCAVSNPTTSNQSCYLSVTNVTSSCAGTSIKGTSTVLIWYFADSTGNPSSSYSAQHWEAYVSAHDALGATSTATSSDVDVNVLTAITIATTTINYSTLVAGQNTSSTNQQEIIQNVGNSSTTLQVSGNAFTSGSNSIATSSQHYATSTFTFGGAEQVLSSTALDISGLTMGTDIDLSRFTQGWAIAQSLPSILYHHSAVAYHNYLYTTGGTDGGGLSTSTVSLASINADGSIGSWSNTTALPSALDNHSAVAYNGYLYTTGGISTTITSTVFYALINSTGSIGSWSNTTALPSGLYSHSAVAYNGYLYTMGGYTGSIVTSTVFQTLINTTGSLGAWSAAAHQLPSPIYVSVGAIYNGYLYSVGGGDKIFKPTSSVFYAPISATGTIGSFTSTTALPSPLFNHSGAVYNGYLYTIGGCSATCTSSTATSTVFYASINGDGSIGSWSNTTALPSALDSHSAVAYNGYLYRTGGILSAVTSSVSYAPLDSRPTYWGVSVPSNAVAGSYQSTVTYVAVFSS